MTKVKNLLPGGIVSLQPGYLNQSRGTNGNTVHMNCEGLRFKNSLESVVDDPGLERWL